MMNDLEKILKDNSMNSFIQLSNDLLLETSKRENVKNQRALLYLKLNHVWDQLLIKNVENLCSWYYAVNRNPIDILDLMIFLRSENLFITAYELDKAKKTKDFDTSKPKLFRVIEIVANNINRYEHFA